MLSYACCHRLQDEPSRQEVMHTFGEANTLPLPLRHHWAPGVRLVASCCVDIFSGSAFQNVCSLRDSFFVAVLRTASRCLIE